MKDFTSITGPHGAAQIKTAPYKIMIIKEF